MSGVHFVGFEEEGAKRLRGRHSLHARTFRRHAHNIFPKSTQGKKTSLTCVCTHRTRLRLPPLLSPDARERGGEEIIHRFSNIFFKKYSDNEVSERRKCYEIAFCGRRVTGRTEEKLSKRRKEEEKRRKGKKSLLLLHHSCLVCDQESGREIRRPSRGKNVFQKTKNTDCQTPFSFQN